MKKKKFIFVFKKHEILMQVTYLLLSAANSDSKHIVRPRKSCQILPLESCHVRKLVDWFTRRYPVFILHSLFSIVWKFRMACMYRLVRRKNCIGLFISLNNRWFSISVHGGLKDKINFNACSFYSREPEVSNVQLRLMSGKLTCPKDTDPMLGHF